MPQLRDEAIFSSFMGNTLLKELAAIRIEKIFSYSYFFTGKKDIFLAHSL